VYSNSASLHFKTKQQQPLLPFGLGLGEKHAHTAAPAHLPGSGAGCSARSAAGIAGTCRKDTFRAQTPKRGVGNLADNPQAGLFQDQAWLCLAKSHLVCSSAFY